MCNVMEEIIEGARAQDLATTPEERAADDRLQRFCGLYDLLESKPDGDVLLAKAEGMLKVLAGWRLAETPAPLEEDPLDGVNTHVAADELAEAFAVIDGYGAIGFIPDNYYARFCDIVTEWTNEADWENNPRLSKIILPALLLEVITRT